MRHFMKPAIVFSLLVTVSSAAPAFARGGGVPNLLNSPGYQRALEESRKRYREQSSQTSAAAPRKTSKHRGHH